VVEIKNMYIIQQMLFSPARLLF